METERILSAAGVNEIIIQAIKAHNPVLEQNLDNLLAKTLFAVEELTGLIVACALVQPDKKLKSVGLESLKRNLSKIIRGRGRPQFDKKVRRITRT